MKLNKKKLIINYEYFIFFLIFLIILTSLNFFKSDTTKIYKLVFKESTSHADRKKNIINLNEKIEREYNINFVEFFNYNSVRILKELIIEKYNTELISMRIEGNKMIILSKVEINKEVFNNFINSEFEKYKLSKIYTNNKFYFCSSEFNKQAEITNLIIKLINMDIKKELVNLNKSNLVLICNNYNISENIILMDFEKFSKIIKNVKLYDPYVITKREFNNNTKQWNLIISLIISYVFFMIIRFSK